MIITNKGIIGNLKVEKIMENEMLLDAYLEEEYIPGINPSIARLINLLHFWGVKPIESHGGFWFFAHVTTTSIDPTEKFNGSPFSVRRLAVP
ncbi:MAG: hypothetical protein HeimC3_16490 [Candidatus Heimdallarchaeota archaeon LC_3]|nr:MAG: hypothetical protein HeimC3_37250 [Candidatus Heimdallarchaeota archaeon LC_3]OLS25205.1 MAG: hypothetical protein HeimC3_16490 [Candidatus Heimdallarchaeota archaeon LC_3]